MTKLTALAVKNAGPGVYSDGKGLLLKVKPSGAKSWILRVQVNKRRQDIGLGSFDDLTLAEARDKAAHLRKVARTGRNPYMERDRDRMIPNFIDAMKSAHAELGKGWTDKSATQFLSSLETHAVPVIGRYSVDQIDGRDVIKVLAPIWTEKPQIARKVRHRILTVLSYSKSHGWRSAPVPSPDELRRGLPKQPKSNGFAAMPYVEVPAFVAGELMKHPTPARLALLFTIFTAARSGEVRKARWDQISADRKLWMRPASIMKAGVAHTVTLNAAALAILELAKENFGGTGLVFPSTHEGKSLSDMSISKMLRSAGRSETVHGFRSSFRDWAAEMMPSVPAMVAEMALAHSAGTAIEKAYLRSDLLDLRFQLSDAWGTYLEENHNG